MDWNSALAVVPVGFGWGVFFGALPVLIVSLRGSISRRAKLVLLTIAALFLVLGAIGLFGYLTGGSRSAAWSSDAGVVVVILAMLALDGWNSKRTVPNDSLVWRTALLLVVAVGLAESALMLRILGAL